MIKQCLRNSGEKMISNLDFIPNQTTIKYKAIINIFWHVRSQKYPSHIPCLRKHFRMRSSKTRIWSSKEKTVRHTEQGVATGNRGGNSQRDSEASSPARSVPQTWRAMCPGRRVLQDSGRDFCKRQKVYDVENLGCNGRVCRVIFFAILV